VGSGGVFGKGLRGSTQGTLGFVPEVQPTVTLSDAVASEEMGIYWRIPGSVCVSFHHSQDDWHSPRAPERGSARLWLSDLPSCCSTT
jgi:hypothetical protein